MSKRLVVFAVIASVVALFGGISSVELIEDQYYTGAYADWCLRGQQSAEKDAVWGFAIRAVPTTSDTRNDSTSLAEETMTFVMCYQDAWQRIQKRSSMVEKIS